MIKRANPLLASRKAVKPARVASSSASSAMKARRAAAVKRAMERIAARRAGKTTRTEVARRQAIKAFVARQLRKRGGIGKSATIDRAIDRVNRRVKAASRTRTVNAAAVARRRQAIKAFVAKQLRKRGGVGNPAVIDRAIDRVNRKIKAAASRTRTINTARRRASSRLATSSRTTSRRLTTSSRLTTRDKALARRRALIMAKRRRGTSPVITARTLAARKLAVRKAVARKTVASKAMTNKVVASKAVARKASALRARTTNADMMKLNRVSAQFSARLTKLIEATLRDAEHEVKRNFPARFVSASLSRMRKQLCDNGIYCQFDRTVDRKALRNASKEDKEITKIHCDEAVDEIVKCVAEEIEATLNKCDKAIKTTAQKHFKGNAVKAIRHIRASVRRNLWAKGLEFSW